MIDSYAYFYTRTDVPNLTECQNNNSNERDILCNAIDTGGAPEGLRESKSENHTK